MGFIKKNSAMIVSLILSYAIISTTGEHWPDVIYKLSGVRVDWDLSKYKLPIVILAFLLLPIISWLKKKLEL